MPASDEPEPAIRPARPEDAAAIAAVHVGSWQATYAGIVAAEAIAAHTVEDRRRTWAEQLATPADPHEATRVATLGGEVVGFASAGPSRDEDPGPRTVGEVRAIYLLPAAWGRGAGRALMADAERFLRAAGFAEATLWVLTRNARARRFYERGGWAPDGAERTDPAGRWGQILRYRKRLGEAAAPEARGPRARAAG